MRFILYLEIYILQFVTLSLGCRSCSQDRRNEMLKDPPLSQNEIDSLACENAFNYVLRECLMQYTEIKEKTTEKTTADYHKLAKLFKIGEICISNDANINIILPECDINIIIPECVKREFYDINADDENKLSESQEMTSTKIKDEDTMEIPNLGWTSLEIIWKYNLMLFLELLRNKGFSLLESGDQNANLKPRLLIPDNITEKEKVNKASHMTFDKNLLEEQNVKSIYDSFKKNSKIISNSEFEEICKKMKRRHQKKKPEDPPISEDSSISEDTTESTKSEDVVIDKGWKSNCWRFFCNIGRSLVKRRQIGPN